MARRTVMRPGGAKEDTLEDADGDTKVMVEQNPDEDKIRFMTAGVERLSIDSYGTAISGSIAITTTQPTILFQDGGVDKATIGVNSSDNILFENKTINKHIVFKVNDQGVTREGLRLNGAVPEVVINEQHGISGDQSLIDFRVESESNTHMLFVSGGSDRVGIGTSQPDYTLDVAGDMGVNQYIYHNGDGNTWINFTENRIRLNAGGNNFIDCEDPGNAPHKVRINNGGNNIDFVIKDNSNNVYFTGDASTSRVGIGTEDPDSPLEVANNNTSLSTLQITTTEDGNSASPILELKRNSSSPASSDYLGQLKFQGENDADQQVTYAKITAKILSPTDGAEQGILEFANMKNGSSGITARLRHDSLQLLNATSFVVNGNTELEGGIKTSSIIDVSSTISAGTLTDSHHVLRCIQSSPITITLPSKGNNAGQVLIIKDALGNAGAHNITIDAAGSDTIDGMSIFVMNNNFMAVTLMCDGINGWMMIGRT